MFAARKKTCAFHYSKIILVLMLVRRWWGKIVVSYAFREKREMEERWTDLIKERLVPEISSSADKNECLLGMCSVHQLH